MAKYRYTLSYSKLTDFLKTMRDTGIPATANHDWLRTLGFTSSNDRSIIPLLKELGFINSSNAPTQMWKDYRGAHSRQVLGAALRTTYAGLFSLHPDACRRSSSELELFFRTKTDAGNTTVKRIVSTFQELCKNADVGGDVSLHADLPKPPYETPTNHRNSPAPADPPPGGGYPSLHIDIQIHISPESTAEQIDQIFSSMANHLYKTSD